MDKLKDLCRLCQDPTQSIYDINQRALLSTVPYSKVISEMLNMEIQHIDHWPTKICLYCITTIHNILTLRKTAKSAQKYFKDTVQEAKSSGESYPLVKENSNPETTYDHKKQEKNPLKRKAEDTLTKESNIPKKKSTPLQEQNPNESSEMVEIIMMPEEEADPPVPTVAVLNRQSKPINDFQHIKGLPKVYTNLWTAPPPKKFKPIPTWGCQYCKQQFIDQETLLGHQLESHRNFSCERCVELFLTEEEMKTHRKLIHDENLCPICKEYVPDFKGHVMRDHTRGRSGCPVCNAQVQGVRTHLEKHMGRFYKCHICPAGFATESLRLSHIKNGACGFVSEHKIMQKRGGDEHLKKTNNNQI